MSLKISSAQPFRVICLDARATGGRRMSTTLLTTGLACIIAAIVGGGLKAFGIELPTLQSAKRQGLLAILGIILIAAGGYGQIPDKPKPKEAEIELFSTKNDAVVYNNPPKPAQFTIQEAYYVTYIWDYHFNNGQGVTPGNIGLRRSDGKVFGPWEVTASNLDEKINWICQPNARIPAGTYTIVDSEPERWSWNEKSGGRGVSIIKAYPAD